MTWLEILAYALDVATGDTNDLRERVSERGRAQTVGDRT